MRGIGKHWARGTRVRWPRLGAKFRKYIKSYRIHLMTWRNPEAPRVALQGVVATRHDLHLLWKLPQGQSGGEGRHDFGSDLGLWAPTSGHFGRNYVWRSGNVYHIHVRKRGRSKGGVVAIWQKLHFWNQIWAPNFQNKVYGLTSSARPRDSCKVVERHSASAALRRIEADFVVAPLSGRITPAHAWSFRDGGLLVLEPHL